MTRHTLNIRIATGLLALLAAGTLEVRGQDRTVLSTGRGSPAGGTTLGANEYGYGALSAGQYGSTGSALYSGIGDSAENDPFRMSRGGGRRRGPAGMEDLSQGSVRPTQSGTPGSTDPDEIVGMGPSDMRDPLAAAAKPRGQVLMVTQQYLEAIGANTAIGVARGRTVTTFVPEVRGLFRDLMEQGQQALLAGGWKDVQRAVDAFSKAQLLTDHNPDVTLSLAHAHFIVARFSYSLPSEYLQQTLILLPELPLVQIEPKLFFDSPDTYDKRMGILASHIESNPDDADAMLVRAYFKWFEPDGAQAAADSLRQAWAASRKPRPMGAGAMSPTGAGSIFLVGGFDQSPGGDVSLRTAIDIFWKGMVKTGKISGSLDQPGGAVTRPAGAAASPGPKSGEGGTKKPADAP